MNRAAIVGMSLSGKSTLAKHISQKYWTHHQMRSFVLDPNEEKYGPHALVFGNDREEQFWDVVWKAENSLIIVDEAAETINRDKTLIPVFTRLRHKKHKLIVIAHHATNLLPVMRDQIDTLYMFRQSEKNASFFAESFAKPELLKAPELAQYHYFFVTLYGTPRILKTEPFTENISK